MRKKNRQVRRMVLGASALCLTLGAVVLGTASSERAEAATLAYTGEQMFRGVFFGSGPAAAALEEIWSTKPRGGNDADAARVQTEVLEQIASADPGFFEHFAAEVNSADHERVTRALDLASARLSTVLAPAGLAGLEAKSISGSSDAPDSPTYDGILICMFVYCHVFIPPGSYYFSMGSTVNAFNFSAAAPLQRDQVVGLVVGRISSGD